MDREIGFETMDNGSHDFLLSCFKDMPGLAGAADSGSRWGNQRYLIGFLGGRASHVNFDGTRIGAATNQQ
jgi:hypothetical protein